MDEGNMRVPKTAKAETDKPKSNGQDGPRSPKGARTRARLVEAAREVFERDGFLTARISDIAATAGLSQGSFYHYFESKEQVFREVAEAQEQRLVEPLGDDAFAHDQDVSVPAAIGQDIRRYLERYRDAARLMAVIEQVSRYDDQVNAARMATQQHFAENAQRIVRGLQRQGRYDKQLDPVITADALSGMVQRFAELWLVQRVRKYDLDEVVEQLTILCVNALGLRDDPVS
jgi:AcrR family transcriptional regulator